jgi:hypothetical protein
MKVSLKGPCDLAGPRAVPSRRTGRQSGVGRRQNGVAEPGTEPETLPASERPTSGRLMRNGLTGDRPRRHSPSPARWNTSAVQPHRRGSIRVTWNLRVRENARSRRGQREPVTMSHAAGINQARGINQASVQMTEAAAAGPVAG